MKAILILSILFGSLAPILSIAQDLTDAEKRTIVRMWEEEKMARDLYVSFAEKWNHPVFRNISKAEVIHMQKVYELARKFHIDDQLADKGPGQFSNADIQSLYKRLIRQGEESLIKALQAGALVEETDIDDLRIATEDSNNQDIKTVYGYLEKASNNHLRAFAGVLRRNGLLYQPVVIDSVRYSEIINQRQNRTGKL